MKKYSYAVILFLTYTLFLYAPLELFYTNTSSFPFGVGTFVWILFLIFALCSALLFFAIKLFPEKPRNIILIIIFSVAVSIWIQGNFLNVSVGGLTGADVYWKPYLGRMVLDLVVWCGVLCVFVLLNKYLKKDHFEKLLQYVSILFILIQSVALVSLVTENIISTRGDFSATHYLSSDGLYEVGEEGNVIVFVMDMYDEDYFSRIIEERSDLLEPLDGFTFFTNYTGNYSTTYYSMTTLFSGQLFRNELPHEEWMKEQEKERLYVDEMTDLGYSTSIYTDMVNAIPDRVLANLDNSKEGKVKITDYFDFIVQIYRLTACKYLPNGLKPLIWMNGTEFAKVGSNYSTNNAIFRDGLYQNGITVAEGEKKYMIIHTDGAHYPYYIDENAVDIPYNSTESFPTAVGCMVLVERYLEEMKANGTYDNSSIIITADHGFNSDGTLMNPMFLAKPAGAHGSLSVNNGTTGQMDFASTVLDLAGYENYSDYGQSSFDAVEADARGRLFYQYNWREGFYDLNRNVNGYAEGNIRLIEFSIPDESNDPEGFELTGREVTVEGEVIDHKAYCMACQEAREWNYNQEKPTLIHEPTDDNPSWKYIDHSFYGR